MAFVTKAPNYFKIPLFIVLLAAIVLLFVNAIAPQQKLSQEYNHFKKKDSLSGYINYLFDRIDETPVLAAKADSVLDNIWRQPKDPDEKIAYYNLLTNIAYHLLQSGQVKSSTRWYEKALGFYQENKNDKVLAGEWAFEEYVCKPLGNNYTRTGDFTKAVIIQQTAIRSATENGREGMLPGLYANLATTYFYMQDYAMVQVITGKGLEAIRTGNGRAAIQLYNLKTEAYLETAQTDSAKYWNDKALLKKMTADDNIAWQVTSLANKARILNAEHKPGPAIACLHDAWDLGSFVSPREKARLANALGNNYFLKGSPEESLLWYNKALSFFQRDSIGLYPDFTVTTSMFGLAQVFEKTDQADSTSFWYTQAVLNDYYTQQLIDAWMYSNSSIYSNELLTEKGIAWHHAMYNHTKEETYLLKAVWLAELSKGRKLMYNQQRSQRLQADTGVAAPAFDELRNDYLLLAQAAIPQEQEAIRARIAEKEYQLSLTKSNYEEQLSAPRYDKFLAWLNDARRHSNIVSYYCSDTAFYMVHISSSSVSHVAEAPASFQDINHFVNTYFYNGPGAFNNNPPGYYQSAAALLKKYLPDASSRASAYIISPAGALHLLPFEALSYSGQKPQYFGAANAISYQFSLLQLLNNAKYKEAAGMAVFSFEQKHLGFPALPSAKEEASFLKKLFNCKRYNAATATDHIFYKELNENNIVHLSSHAVADDSSAQPFIVLQNKLYLGQMQYSRSKCPLVVLAACETGKGASLHQEGMLSLGRTFIGKGVGGVLSARWQVDDATTTALLKNFYKELIRVKEPAKALQQARAIYFGEKTSAADQNPWLWAAIYYQGNNLPVSVKPAGSSFFIYVCIGLLIAAAAAVAVILKKR